MMVVPSWKRIIPVAVVLTLLFLAHVHVFLWTGVMLFTMTIVAFVVAIRRQLMGPPGPQPARLALFAMVSVLPAMALFARWMWRSKQPTPPDELSLIGMQAVDWATFKAGIGTPNQLLANIYGTVSIVKGDEHASFLVGALCLVMICVAIARYHTWKRPPVLERSRRPGRLA